jgi:hypothetical protein
MTYPPIQRCTTTFVVGRLAERNKLVIERLSLRDVILDLEDLVLAHAGVDALKKCSS